MLAATRVAPPLGQIEDLIPVLVNASSAINNAVTQMSAIGTDVRSAITQISELPDAFIRKAKGATEDIGRSTGTGLAKGFGWNILPPLAVGTGIVLGGLLLYSMAMKRVEPERAYAR